MQQVRGYIILFSIAFLVVLWNLSPGHGLFWLLTIGPLAVWIGINILKGIFTRPDNTLGSAQFGSRADVDALAKNKGDLLIGRDTFGRLLRYDGPAHLITIAPTRSGKGVGTIIPNLLTANRSVVCIDPKGENARVTLRARGIRAGSLSRSVRHLRTANSALQSARSACSRQSRSRRRCYDAC